MTIFSLQKFHQKAKNPRKRPIVSKFDVPKVPEPGRGALWDSQRVKKGVHGSNFPFLLYISRDVC